jgi:AcrR family transcriptional regulator
VKQDRARRTHALVLDAAAAEFVAHGFTGTQLERVVARTGLSKGALYGHFSSKVAIADELVEQFEEAWRRMLDRADSSASSPLAACDSLLLELAHRLGHDLRFVCGLRLVTEEARAEGQVPRHFEELRALMAKLAKQAQELGALSPEPSADRIGDSLLAVLVGVHHTTPANRPEQVVDRVRDLRAILLGEGLTSG